MKPDVRSYRLLAGISLLMALASCSKPDPTAGLLPGLYAVLDTTRGTLVVELDYKHAPLASANFAGLAEGTLEATWQRRFFDGLRFHSVQEGLIVQSGCPVGDGTGTAGYVFPDEFHPSLKHDAVGILGMANTGADTNSSQFYLTLDALPNLDGRYTVFGRTVSGFEVLPRIRAGDRLNTVRIVRIGQEATDFGTDQTSWQYYQTKALQAAALRMQKQRDEAISSISARWPELQPGTFDILSATVTEGSGNKPEIGTELKVRYTGMLPDGTIFDRTLPEAEPFSFKVGMGEVIEGWDIIVGNMRKGELRRVAIPPELAYGSAGIPGRIPANSYLIFEIELVDF